MCNHPSIQMTSKVVDFLVQEGELPAVKSVDRRLIAIEDRLTNRMLGMQSGLEKQFIKALRERGRIPRGYRQQMDFISKVFDIPFGNMRNAISDDGVEGLELGRQLTLDDLKDVGMEISFDTFSDSVKDNLKNKLYTFSEDTFHRIKGDFAKTLSQGYEEGLGIDEIARDLRGDFKNLRDYRLRTIARTEVQSAQNEGSHETMREYGVRYRQWLTVGDDRVRGNHPRDEYDHVYMHGQIVEMDEEFSNGLMYPGDRDGDIGDWINCRCRERPYIPHKGEFILTTPYYS